MTITPTELETMGVAADLLDEICTVSQTYLTETQKARALSVIELRLAELRRTWALKLTTPPTT